MRNNTLENETLVINEIGDLDSLIFQPAALRTPNADEVQIEVFLLSLNFKDVLHVLGVIKNCEIILGWEIVGRVVKMGSGVSHVNTGDWVIAYSPHVFSSHVIVPKEHVIKKPDNLSQIDAATVIVAYATAHYALINLANIQNGQRILIHSAAGGVGLAAVQIAQYIGVEIYATAGNNYKRDFLKNLGIEYVAESRAPFFYEEFNDNSFDVILGAVSGEGLLKSFSSLKPYGHYLELGNYGKNIDAIPSLKILPQGASFSMISLHPEMPDFLELMKDVCHLINHNVYQPLPYKIFDKADITKAFRYMSSGQHIGKVIVQLKSIPNDQEKKVYDSFDYAVSNIDGTSLLEEVLLMSSPHVLISKLRDIDNSNFTIDNFMMTSYTTRNLSESNTQYADGNKKSQDSLDGSVSDMRAAVKQIWQVIFETNSIENEDDFFKLGGDSLSAIEISYKIKKKLKLEISPHVLLEHPSFKGFCAQLESISKPTKLKKADVEE